MASARSIRGLCAHFELGGLAVLSMLCGLPVVAQEQPEIEALRAEFLNPPADARPWTWFHVMSGNMSRDGITKDLEAIANAGIGGIVLFHVTQGVSYGPVRFNSAEHQALIEHVAAECERLGLKFSFHNADGWSSSGGPWIAPEHSMKQLVWSERLVSGGELSLTMPQPAAREGFYRDIATIAYPALPGEIADGLIPPVVTSSDPALRIEHVTDGNFQTMSRLTVDPGSKGWVQFSFPEPVTISHVRILNIRERDVAFALEVSDDGATFRPVTALDKIRPQRPEWEVEAQVATAQAQHFRVTANHTVDFGEIALSQDLRIANLSAQSGMAHVAGDDLAGTLNVPESAAIDSAQVIDLTSMIDAQGKLRAALPQGQWTIMRFGYTSTGAHNVVASPEGMGLEVDKFDASAFGVHYDAFLAPLIARIRTVAPNALSGVMIDSYEVGGQNWTDGYENRFSAETGIDLIRWLPIFAGRYVGDGPQTSAMLARIRRFNAALVARNYYGGFAARMREQGLESLIEPYGNGPFDQLEVGAMATVPTGEFWAGRDDLTRLNAAVSVARTYNKPVAAAEAFTAIWDDNWNFSPSFAKHWGDRAWVAGVNQFMFHRFTHQANTQVEPGMTMNRWGSHFDRSQPWWDTGGRAWFTYMARSQHLLRQGYAVSDIALAVGSASPVECPEKSSLQTVLPAGVEFDCLDTPTLLDRSRFENGTVVLPHGTRYAMLWWPYQRPPEGDELSLFEAARAAGIPLAKTHLGDDPKKVLSNARFGPRVSSIGPLPAFTQRRRGETDIFFLFNDDPAPRSFDLCFSVGGKSGEVWNPVSGRSQQVTGMVSPDGCSRLSLELRPYQSQFIVFDPAFAFAQPQEGEVTALARLDDGWSIVFGLPSQSAPRIDGTRLFDWSVSENPEIRFFSGKATYRNTFTVSAADLVASDQFMLDLGQVETAGAVRINGIEVGTVWSDPYRLDIGAAVREGLNTIEIEVANLWVNRLIGDAALPDTSGYEPEQNLGYRIEDNLPKRSMVDWYVANQPAPPGPRRTWSTQNFQKANDPLVPSGLLGPVTIMRGRR